MIRIVNRLIIIIIFLSLLFSYSIVHAQNNNENSNKKVLFLNSYHEGYRWSDDILDAVKAEFSTSKLDIKIDVEYMDTKRVVDDSYNEQLYNVYKYKYKNSDYDLIISSDNAAFNFLLKHGDDLFANTPIVFCGVNNFDEESISNRPLMTGLAEKFDIEKTIELAIDQNPNIDSIYYINDSTTTGVAIQQDFEKARKKFDQDINFIKLDGKDLNAICSQVQNLHEDNILLYFVYFRDNEGNTFEYFESIEKIAEICELPIYSVWDFYLGHGIVGGVLTSGYKQGERVARIALRVLRGENPYEIPIQKDFSNDFYFIFEQLLKFRIPVESLPQDSFIINQSNTQKKKVLLIHSYNKGLQWTEDIERGIKYSLESYESEIEFYYEYMDAKRYVDPVEQYNIREFLQKKYTNRDFDLVIVSDDQAYQFTRNYHHTLFKDTPVVFCGVGYVDYSEKEDSLIKGVTDSIDIKSTIDGALKIDSDIKRVVVINDTSLTGKNNKKNLEEIMPYYSDKLDFELWEDVNMTFIQSEVGNLTDEDIILFLTFNKDKSFNNFSHDESIQLIAEKAKVPIYSVWDFYLDKGIIGGKLISGFNQGKYAGDIAKLILDGEHIESLPIVDDNTSEYMFDYNLLLRYGIKLSDLPSKSRVINKPNYINDFYMNNKLLFIIICCLVLLLLAFIAAIYLLARNNRMKEMVIDKERKFATIDVLTGVLNRRACFEKLNNLIENKEVHKRFSIAFIDIDGLKFVNDRFGHAEGDELIKNTCKIIVDNIRNDDYLCRVGGDEFVVIFQGICEKEANIIWGRIEKSMFAFNEMVDKQYTTSFSVGIVEYSADKYFRPDEMIEDADKKMYDNKSTKYN